MAERRSLSELELLVSAQIDDELTESQRAELDGRLENDPEAAAFAATMLDADRQMRDSFKAVLDEPLPLALVRNISDASRRHETAPIPASLAAGKQDSRVMFERRPPQRGRWLRRAAGVLLAVMAAGAAGYSAGERDLLASFLPAESSVLQTTTPGWIEQVAMYHGFYMRETRHLVEIAASERDHIEAWIGDRTGVAFSVPELDAQDLTFAGARLLLVNGAPIAQLLYQSAVGEVIGICFKVTDKADTDPKLQTFDDVDVLNWNRAGVAFVLAGPTESAVDLRNLVEPAEARI